MTKKKLFLDLVIFSYKKRCIFSIIFLLGKISIKLWLKLTVILNTFLLPVTDFPLPFLVRIFLNFKKSVPKKRNGKSVTVTDFFSVTAVTENP